MVMIHPVYDCRSNKSLVILVLCKNIRIIMPSCLSKTVDHTVDNTEFRSKFENQFLTSLFRNECFRLQYQNTP